MLVYALMEWRFARTINGCSIFNDQRNQQTAEFSNFSDALFKQLSNECRSGEIDTVLFGDDDVALPYIINMVTKFKTCRFLRETAVTPFNAYDLSRCSAILIDEQHLPFPFVKPSVLQAGDMVKISQWTSVNQSFSFSVYRKLGCFSRRLGLN